MMIIVPVSSLLKCAGVILTILMCSCLGDVHLESINLKSGQTISYVRFKDASLSEVSGKSILQIKSYDPKYVDDFSGEIFEILITHYQNSGEQAYSQTSLVAIKEGVGLYSIEDTPDEYGYELMVPFPLMSGTTVQSEMTFNGGAITSLTEPFDLIVDGISYATARQTLDLKNKDLNITLQQHYNKDIFIIQATLMTGEAIVYDKIIDVTSLPYCNCTESSGWSGTATQIELVQNTASVFLPVSEGLGKVQPLLPNGAIASIAFDPNETLTYYRYPDQSLSSIIGYSTLTFESYLPIHEENFDGEVYKATFSHYDLLENVLSSSSALYGFNADGDIYEIQDSSDFNGYGTLIPLPFQPDYKSNSEKTIDEMEYVSTISAQVLSISENKIPVVKHEINRKSKWKTSSQRWYFSQDAFIVKAKLANEEVLILDTYLD